MPKAPAPAAADALKPTIQSAPTPKLVEEDGVVTGGVDDGRPETERTKVRLFSVSALLIDMYVYIIAVI